MKILAIYHVFILHIMSIIKYINELQRSSIELRVMYTAVKSYTIKHTTLKLTTKTQYRPRERYHCGTLVWRKLVAGRQVRLRLNQ